MITRTPTRIASTFKPEPCTTGVPGVKQETFLHFQLSFEGATYTAGESITFKLNIGQSAQIQMATLPSSGLTGSRIVSNKPVAVFSGKYIVRRNTTSPYIRKL